MLFSLTYHNRADMTDYYGLCKQRFEEGMHNRNLRVSVSSFQPHIEKQLSSEYFQKRSYSWRPGLQRELA